jgi:colanic acid/amylovoran biosynthesis glycosyltransferase
VRVLFVLPAFPALSETFILRQATGLLDRGHDVQVLAQRSGQGMAHPQVQEYGLLDRTWYVTATGLVPAAQGPPKPAGQDTALRQDSAERRPGSTAEHGPGTTAERRPGSTAGRRPGTAAGRLARAAREAVALTPSRRLRKKLAALHRVGVLLGEPAPDIVHCHYGEMGLHFGFAATLWSVPLVVSFYGYDCSSYPALHGPDVYRRMFRGTATVTALSDHMKRRLIALGADASRVRIQPLPVDTQEFRFRERRPESDQPVRLLSVARFTEKKGLEYALRAFARVLEERDAGALPQLEYELIGEGPLRAELERLTSSLGIAANVRFRGALAGPAVASAMDSADIFILPSVVASDGDEEGTPTVLLEAAACGLPVLSTRHGGIPEIVEHDVTGILAPERDVETLAAGLRTLVTDAALRRRMGEAARRRAEARFDIRSVAAGLEEIYDDAIAGITG